MYRTEFYDGFECQMLDRTCIWMHVSSKCALGCELRGIYGAQELHELVTDQVGGFVLHPVAHIVEFKPAHETSEGRRAFGPRYADKVLSTRLPFLR